MLIKLDRHTHAHTNCLDSSFTRKLLSYLNNSALVQRNKKKKTHNNVQKSFATLISLDFTKMINMQK